jgi:hypothetical protein
VSDVALSTLPRRPIVGWEKYYEITASGQIFSIRQGRFIAHALDDHQRPYLEVQIGGVRYERNIEEAVEEAWGDVTQLPETLRNPAPVVDINAIKVFDQLWGTYQPPRRWGTPRLYAPDAGKRSLFQCAGMLSADEIRAHGVNGPVEAMAPRYLPGLPTFDFHRCPLTHLTNLKRARPNEANYQPRMGPLTIR